MRKRGNFVPAATHFKYVHPNNNVLMFLAPKNRRRQSIKKLKFICCIKKVSLELMSKEAESIGNETSSINQRTRYYLKESSSSTAIYSILLLG